MSEASINDLSEEGAAPVRASAAATLGQRLSIERIAKEWSIEHVASQLNLAPRQIHALETDNYAALPGMASVRGFVRAYAKLLKIDATPLVAMIASEQITPTQPLEPKRSLPSTPFSDNRLMSGGHRRSSPKGIFIAVIVVLLAIAAVVIERMGGWPVLSQSVSSLKDYSSTSSASPTETPSASAEVQSQAVAEELQPAPAVSAPLTSELSAATAVPARAIATAQPAMSPSVTAPIGALNASSEKAAVKSRPAANIADQHPLPSTAVAVSPPTVPAATAKSPGAGKNLLVLKVRQDTWVEIKSGRNALLSRLLKAGSTEALEVDAPAALTLGNAAGVEVTFRGTPLEIKADAKNNVVRLSLK